MDTYSAESVAGFSQAHVQALQVRKLAKNAGAIQLTLH